MKRITAIAILAALFAAGSINLARADLKEAVVADATGLEAAQVWKQNPHAGAVDISSVVKAASDFYGAVYDAGERMCGPEFVSAYQTAQAAGNTKVMEQLAGGKLNSLAAAGLSFRLPGSTALRNDTVQAVLVSACFQYNIVNK